MRKVSLLIANYNSGNYFTNCYDSILKQTYDNWEVIIVDDCSTDNSIQIIKKLIENDSRFLLFQNSENKGCGYTKRRCVELATGDLCAFLDPDDALYPHALEYSELELEKKSLIGIYSQMAICDENLELQNIYTQTKQICNNKYFFNYPIQITHFFTFRKSAYLKTTGINPNLKKAVDQDLYLKLLEQGNVKFIPEVLYKYRSHSKNISQSDSKQEVKYSFALVIHETMKRRSLTKINKQKIPDIYENYEEIFSLLNYQISIKYRFFDKLKILFRCCFN
ncbi:glycosyltransferase [Chryseobacterium sp. EO14]|uniref:glycosyltransferase family 2 protein n=1 Tax=Chryseobacterium sp. EO14 TaxID=2950551 RepID=UPI00210EF86F|nr:glycosyltransferase [Chryseobacterium sp. EO14]MCQ4142542.1 glycosyltransferase [Chryseobacterium sp. EO14]